MPNLNRDVRLLKQARALTADQAEGFENPFVLGKFMISLSSAAVAMWATPLAAMTAPFATIALPLNRLYAYPFIIPALLKLTQVRVYLTPGTAGSVYRLGVYSSSALPPWKPEALLWDSGEKDGTATGYQTFTLITPLVLLPGVYGQSYQAGVASPSFYYGTPALLPPIGFHEGNPQIGYYKITAYAALPNPYPSDMVIINNASFHYHFSWWRLELP